MEGVSVLAALTALAVLLLVVGWGWNRFGPDASAAPDPVETTPPPAGRAKAPRTPHVHK